MYEFLRYRVVDAMTRDPVTVGPDTTLGELEALFARHDFNGVPVVREDGTLAGFATKLDMLKAFRFRPEAMVPPYDQIMAQPISGVMTTEPMTVPPDRPLTRVLDALVEQRVKSFPVVDTDRLVGVIAREDVLTALRRATRGVGP
ncbi:CBS domain-containing protein [Spiribacter halobius]|uniref:Histidine kinase n=1 Tax=Sediminicurvatus halobius TaxID=2182432 RepID=A0A2U2N8U8_9GAMM|nr:CBS domain-containing protein [Spiribacter halobius]PWG65523.1 histidine kinase [Spiribacter halobius]UEX76548.1 CBS domain-containing protein [Spiribacter halobius]